MFYLSELKQKVLDSTTEEYDFIESKDVAVQMKITGSQRVTLSASTEIDTEDQQVYSTFSS